MNIAKALSVAVLVSSAFTMSSATYARGDGNPNPAPVIFVTSQGLYFDSTVVADPLPQKGNFQELVPTSTGLTTEFGPGDVGHFGGRWWIDLNADGVMDADDKYFLCPLLGPGRVDP